jgi:uncharacterized membrane protein YesL
MKETYTNWVWWRWALCGVSLGVTPASCSIAVVSLKDGFVPWSEIVRQPFLGVFLKSAAFGGAVFILIALVRNWIVRRRIAQRERWWNGSA